MEKNERFIATLSSINNKILREQTSGINELNELINDKEIENIIKNKKIQKIRTIIEISNKQIESFKKCIYYVKGLEKHINEYNEKIKKIEIFANEGKLNIQEIFNISVENNFVGIFRHIMENYRQKIDINAKVNDFNQPLIFKACEKEKDEIFKSLLSDSNISFNYNIFNMVCKKGNLDYVKLTLEEAKKRNKEIDINFDNGTPLRDACLSGNTELVKYLLSLDDIKIDLKDGDENTIFISACNNIRKDYECAKLLYNEYKKRNKTFDINEKNKDNCTAIYFACKNKNIDLVRYLLSIPGIDNIKDFSFFPAACLSGNIKLVQLLYNRFYDKIDEFVITEAFACAINSKNIDLVKYLIKVISDIENKIDFNSKEFMSSFMDTISTGDLEMVELLYNNFKEKININSTVYNNCTALYNACLSSNPKIVDFLLSKKWKENIDINIVNEDGITPFIVSCNIKRYDIARMLYNRPDFDKERNDFNKINKVNLVEFINNKQIYTHKSRIITYFIGDKSFTATLCANSNIKFNFEGLEGITSEQFEKEMNKILNSFENVNSFDTYTSWLPLALIEFKKQERQKNQNIVISDEIEFFDFHFCMDKIKGIIDNNLKNNEDKIVICDFGFSSEELENGGHKGHAIPLVIFNSKDVDGNPQTKILAFNTGFKSKKAFKKLKQKLGDNVEIIKIDKDLLQKYGSCNISPKPMLEALFSSFMNELEEGENLVNKLEQYSKDMIIANRLVKLYEEHGILSEIRKTFFSVLEKLNIIESEQDSENTEKTENTKLTNNVNDVESSPKKQKMETKEEILKDINLEEYLERLKKYRAINERLTRDYFLLYSSGGIYLTTEKNENNKEIDDNLKINSKNDKYTNSVKQQKPYNIVFKEAFSLNKNLDKAIKYVDEAIKKIEMEKDFKNNPMEYLF